jgi:DNA-binding beta-propeller fold protein YncE
VCTEAVGVSVALGDRRRRARTLRVASRGPGVWDRDRLRLVCERDGEVGRALVVTTDFETGVLARADVAAPHRPRRLGTPVHSDALVRVRGDVVAVVNRFLGDNVQILDPERGFRTRLQCSTGPGSNPHDLATVGPRKGYVSRYDRDVLWVIDPGASGCGGFQTGAIALGSLADSDGLPEMSQLAVVGDRLFVTLQRLDRARGFAPTGSSLLAVIDTTTDRVVDTVTLAGSNAFGDASGLVLDAAGRLLVAQAGDLFRTGDGGIEAVDPTTLASHGFIVTEDALGGSITDFVVVGPHKGYAVVLGDGLRNLLVAFDPATGSALGTIATSSSFMPDVAIAPGGHVWLATRGGVRVIDPATDGVVRRFGLGLPPFSIGFVR